jgi:hypothetical protein
VFLGCVMDIQVGRLVAWEDPGVGLYTVRGFDAIGPSALLVPGEFTWDGVGTRAARGTASSSI